MSTRATEIERLATAGNERFDGVIRLAQAIFGAPIAALNLVTETQQFTVAASGTPKASRGLGDSICQYTVQREGVFEVPDLRLDDRFAEMPSVAAGPRVRFYAGVPLHSTSGQRVGSLCLLDLVPRELGNAQREMLADLGAMLEREIAVELEMMRAGEVQALLLPSEPPALEGVEIAGRVQQARAAGGDFFDWQVIDDGAPQLQFVLADVMGKGLSASLIASEVRAVLRTHSRYATLAESLNRTVETIAQDLETNGSFVTMWTGRLDPVTGALQYVDAGHGLGVVVSPRGVRRLAQPNVPLGVPFAGTMESSTDVLEPDETVVIVSDGVFDVFGEIDLALDAVQAAADPALTPAQLVDRVVDYAAAQGASDDLTAVALRRTGVRT
ncbi:PP2C family protein-serine/threonine phosphatase [Microbacterium rhizophilus]|uniref:PP2C family protein-serine/threonine phosphatase n=1 Tax=Microbacterium rhizophilus TaxID=3138934 RepID=UPI0031EA74D0